MKDIPLVIPHYATPKQTILPSETRYLNMNAIIVASDQRYPPICPQTSTDS